MYALDGLDGPDARGGLRAWATSIRVREHAVRLAEQVLGYSAGRSATAC